MTTFKEIRGTAIQSVSTDPSNPETGQIWYNSTTAQLKGYQTGGVWASGGNMATGRSAPAGAGTQTAGLAFGGNIAPVTAATEEYNGTSWTNSISMTTARQSLGGAGTQTLALASGGYTTTFVANTEEYTGTFQTATASNLTTS
jgi:hypothetical protein